MSSQISSVRRGRQWVRGSVLASFIAMFLLLCAGLAPGGQAQAKSGKSEFQHDHGSQAGQFLDGGSHKAYKYKDDDDSSDDKSSDDKSEDKPKKSCLPELQVEFHTDLLSVSVISSKKIKSVTLLFHDGSTQELKRVKGKQGTFAGQGEKQGEMITGAWIRSGCNDKKSVSAMPCPAEPDDGSSDDGSSADDSSSDDKSSDDGSSDDKSRDKKSRKCGIFFENEMAHVVVPVISIADAEASEGSVIGGALEFLVTLSEPVAVGQTAEVRFATVDGTAIAGLEEPYDYIANSGILLFNEGDILQSIFVQIIADDLVEVDEMMNVILSEPVGASIGQGSGIGTIVNDDLDEE